METGDTFQVVQVLATEPEKEGFLMGKRIRDGNWEFPGGKIKKDETVQKAALRELNEEMNLELDEESVIEKEEGDKYQSEDDERFTLRPVKIEYEKGSLRPKGDFPDHEKFRWVKPTSFYEYETVGQYRALDNTGVINGDVGLAVARKDKKYLMLERSQSTSSSGYWTFPGGRKEEGERLEQTALRELHEETGTTGKVVRSGDSYINKGELGYWRVKPFLIEVKGQIKLSEEHSDHEWIKPEEVENYRTLGEFQAFERLGI